MTPTRYPDRLRELVEPGERVLGVAQAELANGVRPKEPRDAPQPPRTPVSGGLRYRVLGGLLSVLSPAVVFEAGDRLVDRVVYGVAGRGARGSAASWLVHRHWLAGHGPGLRETLVAVTDRRLLICRTGRVALFSRRGHDAELAGMEIVWSASRGEVAGARVGWHRLNPKRLRIDFTDGSWVALTVPIAESGAPLRAIAAALR
ncbi:hypothetical protein AB0H57_04145 [Micromonospora sp. NPDC050686]|uniref:hypothetical protein n=1 Tax=Micromonospora sp. NPDC050686 TaxID=3154631 RepID=UPI0033CC547E